MFTNTSSYTRFMRIFILSASLAAFGLSLAPTAAASPGFLETTNPDSTLNVFGHVNIPEASLSQVLADTTGGGTVDATHFEAPKVDNRVSRPLKQFNPHELAEPTKMIKKSGRPDADKTGFVVSKPSIRVLKRDY